MEGGGDIRLCIGLPACCTVESPECSLQDTCTSISDIIIRRFAVILLQWGKKTDVKGLEEMCCMCWKTKELNVVVNTILNKLEGKVRTMAV